MVLLYMLHVRIAIMSLVLLKLMCCSCVFTINV